MNLNDAVTHYFERSNQISTLWSLYVSVTLGSIAFFAAADVGEQVRLLGLLAFVVFSTVNILGLHAAAKQRDFFRNVIETDGNREPVQGVLDVFSLVGVLHKVRTFSAVSVHLVGDIATIYFLWNGVKAA
jgi:hypothetical protein